jgi:hypothetical protein
MKYCNFSAKTADQPLKLRDVLRVGALGPGQTLTVFQGIP